MSDAADRPNGVLLCLVGLMLAAEHLHLVEGTPFPLLGWIAGPLAALTIGVVLGRFPRPALNRKAHRAVMAAASLLIATRLTVSIPPDRLRLGVWPVLPLSATAARWGLRMGNVYLLVLLCWFAVSMVWRIAHAGSLSSAELVPLVVGPVGAALTVAAHVASVFSGQTQVQPSVLVVEQVGLLMVPAGFIFTAIRMKASRGAVGDLLLRVRASSTPLEIQDLLASTISDPHLEFYTWVSEKQQWHNAHGVAESPAATKTSVVISVNSDEGEPLAAIRTDPSLPRHSQLMAASVAAVRLAMQNAAMTAMVRRSRTRLAEAELAERKRLERDLHDGVQQRLLALAMTLDQVVHAAENDHVRSLAHTAAEHAKEALADLRDLARGILPAVLTQSGLGAAVESAAERLPLSITIHIAQHRWPPTTEATAYFVICEGLANVVKHAQCVAAEVSATDQDSTLTVRVQDDGRGGADLARGTGLLGVRDRVAALGGSLTIRSPKGGGTCLTATLPYE
ncbi:sensor histidine kinase [Nocardioides korecus]